MSSIGDLSVELIQNIVHNLTLLDLAALRTTTRYLQLAVDPLFCEVIFIPSGHIEHPATHRFLTDLANGTSAWSRYGRILAVSPLASLRSLSGAAAADSDASNVDLGGLIRLVERAIRVCAPRIRSIQIFRVDPNQSPWLHDIVCSALANLCPEYFALDIAMGCPTTSLPLSLSGLSVLKISTPAPPSNPMFQPTVPFDPPIAAVMDLVTRSPSLRVLHLTGPNDWDLVWTALADSAPRIRLTEVKVNLVSSALISYLGSYSGLERFLFDTHYYDTPIPMKQAALARTFFFEALPRHEETLKIFRCVTQKASGWGIGESNTRVLARMRNLERIEMSVQRPKGTATPLLTFFRTVFRLPRLQRISLTAALGPDERLWYMQTPFHQDQITRTLAAFPEDFCPAGAR